MKYFAMILRIFIVLHGIHMMFLSGFEPKTPLMCWWLAVTLIGIYLILQAVVWPRNIVCPFFKKCREKWGCKK